MQEVAVEHDGRTCCHFDRDGVFVFFSAEGGSWKGHMQTCARSGSPWGPFEPCLHNPVLTHRHRVGHPVQTVGHADMVECSDGSWWCLALGTRHLGWSYHHDLGRESFLVPVCWRDGWPVLGADGSLELEMSPAPAASAERPKGPRPGSTLWEEGWSTIGLAPAGLARKGEEIFLPFGAGIGAAGAFQGVGALLLPQVEDEATFSTELAEVASKPAGVAVHADASHHYSLTVSAGPAGATVQFRRRADDLASVEETQLLGAAPVELAVRAGRSSYSFFVNGSKVGEGSARLLSAGTCENFAWASFALVAEGDSGVAVFRRARQSTVA